MAEYSAIYDTAIERIQKVYNSCSKTEQMQLIKILTEISEKGYSETLETIWLHDFKEVPVSIDQFISDPYYLGSTTNCGQSVYPFWENMLCDLFSKGNKYNEIILSGATRIGKSSTAVTIMAYMLYRLMLYKDPHSYFHKKSISKFTVAFANLNEKLAYGVAYREYQDTLKATPWFMDRGTVSRSDRNFYYIPEGDGIEIIAGSDSSMFLGKQIFCLTGSTEILTTSGYVTLEGVCNKSVSVAEITPDGFVITCDAMVKLTKHVDETIRIYLSDSEYIEGTPEHQIMLTDGSYKMLKDITEDDDIAEVIM